MRLTAAILIALLRVNLCRATTTARPARLQFGHAADEQWQSDFNDIYDIIRDPERYEFEVAAPITQNSSFQQQSNVLQQNPQQANPVPSTNHFFGQHEGHGEFTFNDNLNIARERHSPSQGSNYEAASQHGVSENSGNIIEDPVWMNEYTDIVDSMSSPTMFQDPFNEIFLASTPEIFGQPEINQEEAPTVATLSSFPALNESQIETRSPELAPLPDDFLFMNQDFGDLPAHVLEHLMPEQLAYQLPQQISQQISQQIPQQMPEQIIHQIPQQMLQQPTGEISQQVSHQTFEQIPQQVYAQVPEEIAEHVPSQSHVEFAEHAASQEHASSSSSQQRSISRLPFGVGQRLTRTTDGRLVQQQIPGNFPFADSPDLMEHVSREIRIARQFQQASNSGNQNQPISGPDQRSLPQQQDSANQIPLEGWQTARASIEGPSIGAHQGPVLTSQLASSMPHQIIGALPQTISQLLSDSRGQHARGAGPSGVLNSPRMPMNDPQRPPKLPLSESFWRGVLQMLREPFRHIQLDEYDARAWLSYEDITSDQLTAIYMAHESLLSQMATVRCPVYAMVFRWITETKRDPDRFRDLQRRVTRYLIQMLSYRVALEPRFYHDVFFVRRFGSLVGQFARMIKHIEDTAQYVNQMDVWYDLMGCLLEYGAMPGPHGPHGNERVAMNHFLTNTRRRRLLARLRRLHGPRNERPSIAQMERITYLSTLMTSFEKSSYRLVVAMMDPQVLNDWVNFVNDMDAYAVRNSPPEQQSYPMWPEPPEQPEPHCPDLDFPKLSIYIPIFRDITKRRAENMVGNIHLAPQLEPYLSPHASYVSRHDDPIEDQPKARARKYILNDIATYFHVRYLLVKQDHHSYWAKLPIQTAQEFKIIMASWDELQLAMRDCKQAMDNQLDDYKTLGLALHMFVSIVYYNIDRYRMELQSMRTMVVRMAGLFDMHWHMSMLSVQERVLSSVERNPTIVPPPSETRNEPNLIQNSSTAGTRVRYPL